MDKTGCRRCDEKREETQDNLAMCDICELGMLAHTAEAALQNYKDKANEIIVKLKKEKE